MAATAACNVLFTPTSTSFLSGSPVRGLLALQPLPLTPPSSSRQVVVASSGKKIKVKQPLGPSGGAKFRNGVDASGRAPKGKGVYQFTNKYGANVDGYSPIYAPEEWSPTGDVYAGGPTGLAIWAVTLAGVLLGAALLVYNTSALAK